VEHKLPGNCAIFSDSVSFPHFLSISLSHTHANVHSTAGHSINNSDCYLCNIVCQLIMTYIPNFAHTHASVLWAELRTLPLLYRCPTTSAVFCFQKGSHIFAISDHRLCSLYVYLLHSLDYRCVWFIC
jgi:hypothetical protein